MNYTSEPVYNKVQCGYLDNICFDFKNGNLPLDDINNNKLGMFDGLTWQEEAKIKKWYNLAIKDGANSVAHLKLCYTVAEIIKKYLPNAHWCNRFISTANEFW